MEIDCDSVTTLFCTLTANRQTTDLFVTTTMKLNHFLILGGLVCLFLSLTFIYQMTILEMRLECEECPPFHGSLSNTSVWCIKQDNLTIHKRTCQSNFKDLLFGIFLLTGSIVAVVFCVSCVILFVQNNMS